MQPIKKNSPTSTPLLPNSQQEVSQQPTQKSLHERVGVGSHITPENSHPKTNPSPCKCVDLTNRIQVGDGKISQATDLSNCLCEDSSPKSRVPVGNNAPQNMPSKTSHSTNRVPVGNNAPQNTPQTFQHSSRVQIGEALSYECSKEHPCAPSSTTPSIPSQLALVPAAFINNAKTISTAVAPGLILFASVYNAVDRFSTIRNKELSTLKKIENVAIGTLSTAAAVSVIIYDAPTAIAGAAVLTGMYVVKVTLVDRVFKAFHSS